MGGGREGTDEILDIVSPVYLCFKTFYARFYEFGSRGWEEVMDSECRHVMGFGYPIFRQKEAAAYIAELRKFPTDYTYFHKEMSWLLSYVLDCSPINMKRVLDFVSSSHWLYNT